MKIHNKYLLFLVFLLASTGPITSTLYLPSIPYITADFNTSSSFVQLSIALFFLGYSIARLVYATVSDAVGRKYPVLVGLAICIIGSLICLFATNINDLIAGRFLQGLGVGGSNVLARVILRDMIKSKALAKYNSYYSMVNIMVMVIAPLFGGYLQHYFGWQSNFIVLTGYSVIALLCSIILLPETNQNRSISNLRPRNIVNNMKTAFVSKAFVIAAILLMLGYGSMAAWLTAGPMLLENSLALSPVEFGWSAAIVGLCFFIGAMINSKIASKAGLSMMFYIGSGCILLSSIMMLTPLILFHSFTVFSVIAPVSIAVFGISLLVPNAYASGLTGLSKIAGIAVALLAFLQMLGGAISSSIMSILPEHNQLPLGLLFLFTSISCLLILSFKHIKYEKTQPKRDNI